MSAENEGLNRNEVSKNTEAVDVEKLAEDIAGFIEKEEFTQIEILAQQMEGTLDREDIAKALKRGLAMDLKPQGIKGVVQDVGLPLSETYLESHIKRERRVLDRMDSLIESYEPGWTEKVRS
jgi:hypothetical protein